MATMVDTTSGGITYLIVGLLLVVDSSNERHNRGDTEEVVGVNEKADTSYDDGLEMV